MMTEDSPEQDTIEDAVYNKFICVEVIMDVPGEFPRRATVRRHVEEFYGEKVGTYHQNSLMDNQEYELEYDDGTHDHYCANVADENLYSQVDSKRNQFLIFEYITDHWSDVTDIAVADGFIIN